MLYRHPVCAALYLAAVVLASCGGGFWRFTGLRLDDSRVLVNTYALNDMGLPTFNGGRIYNYSGTKLGALPLPELRSVRIASAGSVYDPRSNATHSMTTWTATRTTASPSTGAGAVAGSTVAFASGTQEPVQSF